MPSLTQYYGKTVTQNSPKCLSRECNDNHITDILHTATRFPWRHPKMKMKRIKYFNWEYVLEKWMAFDQNRGLKSHLLTSIGICQTWYYLLLFASMSISSDPVLNTVVLKLCLSFICLCVCVCVCGCARTQIQYTSNNSNKQCTQLGQTKK